MRPSLIFIKLLSMFTLIISISFCVICIWFPEKIVAGTPFNAIASFFSSVVLLEGIVLSILYLIFFKNRSLFENAGKLQYTILGILTIYFLIRVFIPGPNLENGLSTTSGKVQMFLALSNLISFYIYIVTGNILKSL